MSPTARVSGMLTPEKQNLLFENTVTSVGGASTEIQQRHIDNCAKADPAYGAGVAAALARAVVKKTPQKVI